MVLFSLLCRSSSATPVEPRPFLSGDRLANGPLPEPLFAVSLRRSSALICITSHIHNHHLQWHRAGSHWYPPFCDFKVEYHISALSCCRLSTRGVRMRFRESTIHHLYIVINTSCPQARNIRHCLFEHYILLGYSQCDSGKPNCRLLAYLGSLYSLLNMSLIVFSHV
jgi:hypothetical protein